MRRRGTGFEDDFKEIASIAMRRVILTTTSSLNPTGRLRAWLRVTDNLKSAKINKIIQKQLQYNFSYQFVGQ